MDRLSLVFRSNIKISQDRAHFYAYHNSYPHVLTPRKKVLLHPPPNSKSFSKGNCSKISLCCYGPFIKHISPSAYRLKLQKGIDKYFVFHVSWQKELINSNDYTITIEVLVIKEDLSSKPRLPRNILDARGTKHLRSKQIQEFKIKWLD